MTPVTDDVADEEGRTTTAPAAPAPAPAPVPKPVPASARTPRTRPLRARALPLTRPDLLAVACAVALFAAAAAVGTYVQHTYHNLFVAWPPLFSHWEPHLGPGTPAALAVALAVAGWGPALAARLRWRALLPAAWGAAMAWTWSLALVDGWHRGIATRLTTRYEYLQALPAFHDISAALHGFTHHILLHSPHHWPAHVAGHPPAATLTFVLLDRIGLGGGGWAAVWVLTVGTSAATAALVTLRALAGEGTARRAAPFLVLSPAAVWAGVSADGYYTAVAAWTIALLALSATTRATRTARITRTTQATRTPRAARAPTRTTATPTRTTSTLTRPAGPPGRTSWQVNGFAFAAGLLFGLTCYLSYGLTLMALPAAGVLLVTRTLRPLPALLAGTAVLPVVCTLAGFNWWEAYQLLLTRYAEGAGGIRPYGYWVWANLACTVLITGFATAAGLRRALAAAPGAVARLLAAGPLGTALLHAARRPFTRRAHRPAPADHDTTSAAAPAPAPASAPVSAPASAPASAPGHDDRLVALILLTLLAVLAADLSGMSKAETERIWQPFALWLLPAAGLLPRPSHRWWLAAQAALALLINHLLATGW